MASRISSSIKMFWIGVSSSCQPKAFRFVTKAHVGKTLPVEDLQHEYDAILLAGGSEQPRDLTVPGRELKGVHFAMEFLPQQNRRCEGDTVPDALGILATGKHVVIIGGGDTGADCLGTQPPAEGAIDSSVRDYADAAAGSCSANALATVADAASRGKLTKKAEFATGVSPRRSSRATNRGM